MRFRCCLAWLLKLPSHIAQDVRCPNRKWRAKQSSLPQGTLISLYPKFFMAIPVNTLIGSKEAGSTNPRGIPYAPFVDKVEDYVTSRDDVESTLKSFQELIS
jgi:hypothetical protein